MRRIRELYRYDRNRRIFKPGTPEFTAADTQLRQTAVAMQTWAEAELADPKLRTPCRKVLVSFQEHWDGLTRFLNDPRIPLGHADMDPSAWTDKPRTNTRST
jgi:transposase